MTDYHPVAGKITSLLKENGCWFETFEHEPVITSEDAAKVRPGYDITNGAKALITRAKEPGKGKRFVMFVLPGNARFDEKKIKEQFGLTELRFASEAEVAEITGGIVRGGVPPFGNFFGLDVFADEGVLAKEKIVFNAGDRRFSVGMLSKDYIELVRPKRGDFTRA